MANKSLYAYGHRHEEQCLSLLRSLKETVEWLLSSCSSDVWSIYGNLSHLYVIVDDILSHGLRYQTYWRFICSLRQLQPALAPPFIQSPIGVNATTQQESFQSHLWLKKSLQEHKLSIQLQSLICDPNHLQNYYDEGAFLRSRVCTTALLICLKAVEYNQPSLLASLDPVLVLDSKKHYKQQSVFLHTSKQSTSLKQCCDIYAMQSLQHDHTSLKEGVCVASCSCRAVTDDCETTVSEQHSINSVSSSVNNSAHSDNKMGCMRKHRWKPQYPKGKFTPKLQRRKLVSDGNRIYSKQFLHNNNNNYSADMSTPEISPHGLQFSRTDVCTHAKNNTLPPPACKNTSHTKMKLQRSFSCPDSAQKSSNINRHKRSSSSSHSKANVYPLHAVHKCSETDCSKSSSKNCDSSLYSHQTTTHIPDSKEKLLSAMSSLEGDTSQVPASDCDHISTSQTVSTETPATSMWKVQHSRSKSDISVGKMSDKNDDTDSVFSLSLPSVLSEDKSQGRKSIFEGNQIVVPTECFFPRPHQGQSLTSFLSSNAFNICAELDRENAHFCIAEALISAIEHVKCTQSLKTVEDDDDSDEEIQSLKQRIRIRRRERQREKAVKNVVLLSDGRTDTTTSQSPSSPLSSCSSDCDAGMSGTDDDVEDLELSDPSYSRLSSVKETGLSLSMASLYSDADIQRAAQRCNNQSVTDGDGNRSYFYEANINSAQHSAESVALSLLRKYSEKQLPKASDLQWLVSEQDAPQRLLPLPDSWPVSPDTVEEEYNLEKTRLRGNLEWAPPRAQIIFNIHPDPKRKEALEKQKYRCAGCGTKVEKGYSNRFRYCDYLGKYFCQCCHGNNLAYIPGRILRKWDLTKYYVSKFSYDLLDQMYGDPLFNVMDINNGLYKKARQLDLTRECRIKLFFVKDFIKTCRNAESLQDEMNQYPSYIFSEPHLYSISDIVEVKSGEMSRRLQQLLMKCVNHVMQCVLCQAKGFICETCNNETDIIFPFQTSKVKSCVACGSCFHKKCFTPEECSKCARIEERKRRLESQRLVLSDEEA